jgi:hypothetical protein
VACSSISMRSKASSNLFSSSKSRQSWDARSVAGATTGKAGTPSDQRREPHGPSRP